MDRNEMDSNIIRHNPRQFHFTLSRKIEVESECPDCPPDQPDLITRCADCGSVMVYRGIGRLRSGTRVHYYECVHSAREIHSVSLVIGE